MSGAENLISVRHVTKSFAGAGDKRVPVLEGIDLEVADSEFVALLGRSGSGKSTLLRCMAGLIAPTSGEVLFRGSQLVGCNPGTAMVFQTFALLPWLSVQQNVEIGLEARGVPGPERAAQALRAIDLVGLDGYESAFPKELSGGMRQRVGFARALVLEPDVLLMDEPFSALDVLTAENLRGELLELWEGKRFPTRAVVMVTHNIEEAVLLADRILVLGTNPGRLRAELVNHVPRPRHRRTQDFDALVDHIYEIMTGAPERAVVARADAVAPRGTPGDTPLPHASVDGLSGLAEILEHRDGLCDLADLARLLGLEVDDMLPLVDALVLLGLATLEGDALALTASGRAFAGASIQESKRIFAGQALDRAPLVRTIDRALRGSNDGNLPSGFFSDLLQRSFGEAEARQQLDTAINWGRYAELYAYEGGRDQLRLEEHEWHHSSEERTAPTGPERKGALRVYLGAYPGSGKTFAMLRDAHRRLDAGEDVVIAAVDSRTRPHTEEATGTLERVPGRETGGAGGRGEEMDLEAVFRRHPQVALVDDLAHVNAPGSRNAWRWQDVDALVDAGIDVMTTLDASQLEGQRASVEHITGAPVAVTVPDSVLDRASDVQFVDIAPAALRRRIAHGNVCPHDEIESALGGPFRLEALGPLRELALRLVARRVGGGSAPARLEPQDVVVAAAPSQHAESLVRRGARLARRTGGHCTVLTVDRARGAGNSGAPLSRVKATAEQLGLTYIERHGGNVEQEIREIVREVVAQHLIIGSSDPRRLRVRRSTPTDRLIETLPDVDVHVIAWLPPAAAPGGTVSEEDEARFVRRGALRLYLGYAHGCGTTTAMLEEARRRASRGTDCVVAAITHSHPGIEAALGDLELLGADDGVPSSRPDIAAVLARNPQVVCVDDLAAVSATTASASDAVGRLLNAGITVIATMHVTDRVNDALLERADDIELVDLPPSVLIERVRAGQAGHPNGAGGVVGDDYSEENLTRQREQAFRIVAWHSDRQQVEHLRRQGAGAHWEARPRVMACVAPRPGMERLIRRAASLAASLDTDFRAVTVRTAGATPDVTDVLERYAALTDQLGGQVVRLEGPAVGPALAQYARDNLVTEMLAIRGSRGSKRSGSTLRELTRTLSDVDIHILSVEQAPPA